MQLNYEKLFGRGFDYVRFARYNWVKRKKMLMFEFDKFTIAPEEIHHKTRIWLIILELYQRLWAIEKMLTEKGEGLTYGDLDEVEEMLARTGINLRV